MSVFNTPEGRISVRTITYKSLDSVYLPASKIKMASTSQAANSPGVSAATTTPSSKSQTPSIINSQLGDGNRSNNFEPLDKSSSNTLKVNYTQNN